MGKETLISVTAKLGQMEITQSQQYQQLSQQLSQLIKNQSTLNASIKNLDQKVQDIGARIDMIEKRSIENEKRCVDISASIAEEKSATMKEIYDIEAKRLNLVIFGIQESAGSAVGTGTAREKDIKAIDEVIEVVAGAKKPFELKFRIGKKGEKPRPILIMMPNAADKEIVLSNAKSLGVHPQWKKVFIKQDLTQNQREFIRRQDEELAVIAESRNAELKNEEEWRWAIRGRGTQRHLAKIKSTQA